MKIKEKLAEFWYWFTGLYVRFVYWEPVLWLRVHLLPSHRYHIINLKKTPYPYKWGWIDRDEAILIASFKILQDYVEKEDPGVGCDERLARYYNETQFQDAALQAEMEAEIRFLYNWWTVERPKQVENRAKYFEWNEIEEQKTDNEMLHRLIEVRNYLWT